MFGDLPGEGAFTLVFGVAAVVIGLGFVATIVLAVINFRRVRDAGHNPFTLETDLATRALDSGLLAPSRSVEDRLRELQGLRDRGVITAEEYATARADILRGS
ncbi:MAG: hypothetical protein JWR33_1248 [Naasia sp.]|jgi:hypothetical protein|uniref:SHOCT domain-containing protein n=1 Tax=Naasia sp. TaxID=2546198 RepID=UPI00260C3829|nr:SHOCT domain-containing protein [Naasia sp.]MCU1570507.1 hypothetical protein [Naasia sp.]